MRFRLFCRLLLLVFVGVGGGVGHADPVLGRASHLRCDVLPAVIVVVGLPLILIVLHLLNKLEGVLALKKLGYLLIMLLLQRLVISLRLLKLVARLG